MSTNPMLRKNLQAVETDRTACSGFDPKTASSAADCPPGFHGRVIRTFEATLDMRKTARETKAPRWLVNEILHARDFVRQKPPGSARGLTLVRRAA